MGPKIAAALINHFGNLESLYSKLAPIKKKYEDPKGVGARLDKVQSVVDNEGDELGMGNREDAEIIFSTYETSDKDLAPKTHRRKSKQKVVPPEQDIPLINEIEVATQGVRCSPTKAS